METATAVMDHVTEAIAPPGVFAGVADERLEAELCQLAADIAAGTARWLQLVGEYDRRKVWQQWECRSMAHWLVWHIGISLVTARQYVQVAATLPAYPLLAAEFAAGRLSYSRVRALCRFITPGTEAELVGMAGYATAAQLERFAAGVERAKRSEEPSNAESQYERRSLQLVLDDDGSWVVRGRLTAEMGTSLRRALDAETVRIDRALIDPVRAEAEAAGKGRRDVEAACRRAREALGTFEQRRSDALVQLIEAGHVSRERDGDSAASPRPLIVVHRYPDGDEIENGPAIPPDVADRLACEADHITATHIPDRADSDDDSNDRADDDSDDDANNEAVDDCNDDSHQTGPADTTDPALRRPEPGIRYGRRRRHPTTAMRRLVEERDRCCRVPGCARRGHLHAHHVQYFAKDGLTIVTNLILLCGDHHRSVHHRGWTISGTPDGEVAFHVPDRHNQSAPFDGDLERLVEHLDDQHGGPIRVLLYGDRFDVGLAVANHLHNDDIARRRAAEATVATSRTP